MPEAVTQYKTYDGKFFHNESDAEQWERDTNKARGIESMFPNNGYLSDADFYRLPMQLITDARHKLCDALHGQYNTEAIQDFKKGNNRGILGRYLDDSGSPYNKVYWLFQCIDDQRRMFSQPFFANNPDKAENEVGY